MVTGKPYQYFFIIRNILSPAQYIVYYSYHGLKCYSPPLSDTSAGDILILADHKYTRDVSSSAANVNCSTFRISARDICLLIYICKLSFFILYCLLWFTVHYLDIFYLLLLPS